MPKSFLITNKRYNNISSSSSSSNIDAGLRDAESFQVIDLQHHHHHHQHQQQQQSVDEEDPMTVKDDETRVYCGHHKQDEDNDVPSPTASVSSSNSCNNFESDILDVCSLDNIPKPFDLRCPPLPRGGATFSSPMSPPGGDTTPSVSSPPSDALSRLFASVMVDSCRPLAPSSSASAAAARFPFFPDPRLSAGIPPFQPSLYPFSQPHPELSRQLPAPPQHPEDRVLMPLVHKLLLQHRHQLQQVVATAAIHQRDRSSTFSPCASGFDSDSADSGVVAMTADRSPSGPVGAAVDAAAAAASTAYPCVECGRAYSTASNLARHRQSHRIGTTGSGFGSASSSSSSSSSSSCSPPAVEDRRGGLGLLEGGGSTTQTSSRKCPHCDKAYSSAPAYSMHVRTHSQGCACPQCGKRFSRPWLLQGHIRTHTGEKPFRCPHCGKTFADKSNLRAHIQTHSPDKPHVCGRCGKAFALRSYLYKHEESSCMRSHRLYHGYPYLRPPPPSSAAQQQRQL